MVYESAKRGDRRTNLKSPSQKARGLGYLWDKEAGQSEAWGAWGEWGKGIGNRKTVR